jgi:hypothetical protein
MMVMVVTELYIKTLEQVQHTIQLDAETKSYIPDSRLGCLVERTVGFTMGLVFMEIVV